MRGVEPLAEATDRRLWPLLEQVAGTLDVAGLAVAVVRGDEVSARGFGVRHVGTRTPVTPATLFHLASVSKPVVATAVVSLSVPRDGRPARLDLDAPVVDHVPELTLADRREREVTARGLLSHTSGLPDVTDYGWHEPRLDDDALADFARSLSGMRLRSDPGTAFAYSNAGYELLGLLLARATGTTFEDAVRRLVLDPVGMRHSTFLRAEVPPELAASPHVGMPLAVPDASYPYTRSHAPSSSLHSSLDDLCRWVSAHVHPAAADALPGTVPPLDPAVLDLMARPVVEVGEPPWDEAMALGWAVGAYRGHRTIGHSGLDPGFGCRLVLVPERETGVVVLANSDTVPASSITMAALDVALGGPLGGTTDLGIERLRALRRPVVGPVAEVLGRSGARAAVAEYHRLAAADPPVVDLDDDGFADAVWGAVELHRTELVRPLLDVWAQVRPGSSPAWTMTGWADAVDGDHARARTALLHALELDPGNDEASQLLAGLPPPAAGPAASQDRSDGTGLAQSPA